MSITTMKKICIALLFFAVAIVGIPLFAGAQTAELTEAEKLVQIAVQLEEIEQQVNYLTLLVTKLTLERRAADLQRQLAALMPSESIVVEAPPLVAAQPAESPEDIQAGPPQSREAGLGGEDVFAKVDIQEDERATKFSAALGPLGNLGKPELAALLILALLAVFVLARRFRGRKEVPKGSAPVSPPPSSQALSQPQGDLLQEGRQELKENVVWK